MRKKLRQQKGETLIEAMSSLLIALLSMLLLTTAVMTAAHINQATRAADETFQENLKYAEGHLESEDRKTELQSLYIDFQTLTDIQLEVEVYGGSENPLISYEEEASGL